MITLSNGHQFQFMTASGALAFDGRGWPWEWPLRWGGLLDPKLFTIVIKTLTRYPRPGNLRWSHPWSVVKPIGKIGVVNAIGLTNPGIEWWIKKVAPKIPENYSIVASIESNDEREATEMLELLRSQRVCGIELNLSCPNTKDCSSQTTDRILAICRRAAQSTEIPLIAKLSFTHDYLHLARELQKLKNIQAISINSIPWSVVFPQESSPLLPFGGGGVSGKVIQRYSWKMVEELAKTSRIPVIGPSIWEYDDIQKVIDRGAQAVSFGSIFVRHPWRPTSYVRQWMKTH